MPNLTTYRNRRSDARLSLYNKYDFGHTIPRSQVGLP